MLPLAQMKAAEARRRLQLLGTTVEDTRGTLLGVRARQVGIPVLCCATGTPAICAEDWTRWSQPSGPRSLKRPGRSSSSAMQP